MHATILNDAAEEPFARLKAIMRKGPTVIANSAFARSLIVKSSSALFNPSREVIVDADRALATGNHSESDS